MNKLFFKKVLFCFKGSLLIALVCLIIYSCSKSNDGEEVFLQSFHPIEVNNKSNLSSEDYSRVIRVLEDAILSTDLAVYFRYACYL